MRVRTKEERSRLARQAAQDRRDRAAGTPDEWSAPRRKPAEECRVEVCRDPALADSPYCADHDPLNDQWDPWADSRG